MMQQMIIFLVLQLCIPNPEFSFSSYASASVATATEEEGASGDGVWELQGCGKGQDDRM